jgi:glutamine synthetase
MYTYEYIWLGGNDEFRGKTRVLDTVLTIEKVPLWNYDGSSTKQAEGHDSEVILHPVKLIKNPLIKREGFIVLCETRKPDGTPLENNHRVNAKEIFDKHLEEKPWFGLEQEYFLVNPINSYPIGFTDDCKSRPQ